MLFEGKMPIEIDSVQEYKPRRKCAVKSTKYKVFENPKRQPEFDNHGEIKKRQ
jgi:hypothetical protein